MDEKDQTILWMGRVIAQLKMNETRLAGEVVKGNAAIAAHEDRIKALEAELAAAKAEKAEAAKAEAAKGKA